MELFFGNIYGLKVVTKKDHCIFNQESTLSKTWLKVLETYLRLSPQYQKLLKLKKILT